MTAADLPRFVLVKRTTGTASHGNAPAILLHDRYQDLTALDEIAESLNGNREVIAVRGARSQIQDQFVLGYFWFLEPAPFEPEWSTVGDALSQLEQLVLSVAATSATETVTLVGEGQGATMALLLASIWPEKVKRVVAIDGYLPPLPNEVGIDESGMAGCSILLLRGPTSDHPATEELERRGAEVTTRTGIEPRERRLALATAWLIEGRLG